MVCLRSKWRQYKAVLELTILSLLLFCSPACAFHTIPGSQSSGAVSGSGSGPVTWANWSGRNEPGGTTAFVVQMESGVTGGNETGYGYGVESTFVQYGGIGPSAVSGFRTSSGGSSVSGFTIPADVMSSTILGNTTWTFVAYVADYKYHDIVGADQADFLTYEGGWGIELGPNNARIVGAGSVTGWHFSSFNSSAWVSCFVTPGPPRNGPVYLYAWFSGVSYACAWDTAKRTRWVDIPVAQKAQVVSTGKINTFGTVTFNAIAQTIFNRSVSIKWLWFSNSCEIN